MTRIARWFLDITLDGETLRWWSGNGSVTFDGNSYTGLGTRWKTPDSLKRKASLKSETISLEFDSSRQSDNTDPIGYLLDQTWRRRQVRLRRMAWDTGQTPDDGDALADERGRIRSLADELKADEPAKLTMEIESGALAYLERRMETRSSASQKRVFAGDLGFDLMAQLEGVTLAWRTKHKKAGTVQVQLMDEFKPEPRKLALGRFATTGSFVGAFTVGQQNKNLVRVYAIADHRINKLDKVWINGDLVRSTALTHGSRTLVRLQGDKNENRCWVTFYDGRDNQVADSYLVGQATNWTTNHRLRGVAYVIVEHLWDSDLPENFDYRFGGEGARLYDRRQDSTAGGSGTQRWDDPSTWVYTTNAMVAADHYRSGIRIMSGSTDFWFGVGEDRDAVPYAEFEALADHCDENVALKAGGTQKRYEVNGILSADQSHDKNLQRLADQMAARVIDQGGRVAFRPPIIRTPVVTLTDDDLVRGSTTKIDPAGRIDDMVNTIDGQFINPANDYKKDDVPAVQVAAYVDADNGEISDTRNLDLENSGERGQRIFKLIIEDSRRILDQEETYGTKAKAIEPGEWFVRESVIRGFPSGKMFIADEVERFIDGSVSIKASEVYPDELVWDESTAVDLSVPPALPQLSLPDLPVPSVSVVAVALSGGGSTVPAFEFTHSGYADFTGDEIEIEYGVAAGSDRYIAKIPGNVATVVALAGAPPSTSIAFRFRARLGERISDWSSQVNVTSTSTYEAATSGVADSFIGQQWGATATEAEASNAQVPAGQNALFDTGFHVVEAGLLTFWSRDGTATYGTMSVATQAQGLRVWTQTASPSAASQYRRFRTVHNTNALRVQPGDRVGARVKCAGTGPISSIAVRFEYRDDAGTLVGTSTQTYSGTIPTGTGGGETFQDISVIGTVPSGATQACIAALFYASGSGSMVCKVADPLACLMPAGQSVVPLFSPGFPATPGADPTEDNVSDSVKDQGVFATANYYEQSADPGAVANGSLWFKTTTDELFIRRSGSWGLVANISSSVTPISVTRASGDFVNVKIGSGTNNTGAVTFSATGGSGAITFAHELVITYTSGPNATITSASGTTTAVTASGTVGQYVRGFVITTATDAVGNKVQFTSPVYLTWES